jgi:hypothetical protein
MRASRLNYGAHNPLYNFIGISAVFRLGSLRASSFPKGDSVLASKKTDYLKGAL